MPTIGVADILIRPSFKGLQQTVGRELDGVATAEGTRAGSKMGGALGGAMKVGALAVAGGAVAPDSDPPMWVILSAGLAIALPIVLWQVWAFFAPAVEPHFQRTVLVFVVLATALFAIGVVFMYYVVLPRALDFLTSYDDELYDIQIRASYYYSFAAVTLLAGGVAFLMPIFLLGLVRLRVLSSDRLRNNRRIAFVGLLVFAILLPTVDPVSLAFEVIPLVLLFELSIWLSVLMERRWQRSWDDDLAEAGIQ